MREGTRAWVRGEQTVPHPRLWKCRNTRELEACGPALCIHRWPQNRQVEAAFCCCWCPGHVGVASRPQGVCRFTSVLMAQSGTRRSKVVTAQASPPHAACQAEASLPQAEASLPHMAQQAAPCSHWAPGGQRWERQAAWAQIVEQGWGRVQRVRHKQRPGPWLLLPALPQLRCISDFSVNDPSTWRRSTPAPPPEPSSCVWNRLHPTQRHGRPTARA